ncbi:OsmC family protein [Amycolatopsis thermophila]|uniref:Organic hydroperoxide reductase OsmC/OhrA n=1 Tax=Amycolatopsis thermophila TaxID=206084 RepID=A0ABU0F364_9PSEU|nr:OsmC family protein [Amycolatopsis thermophila]MDQ0382021.1 organic hydroperoxide reductase OsmC/OhrA [Amycolatopsis thermophila]
MGKEHGYRVTVAWSGTTGDGYRGYDRAHDVTAEGKPPIAATADPAFLGDPARWNPEELLLASLSQCHLLTYLALCARHGITVTAYRDNATGRMAETPGGGGHFTEATLNPEVTVSEEGMAGRAADLHHQAHELCFIANSVNFPVHHQPTIHIG